MTKVALTIAGSDSGGGAGIQADLRTFAMHCLHGASIDTQNTHGTGCTLSAAICANLALGKDLWSAVVAAKKYVTMALEHSLAIGTGNGPVGHFFPLITKP